MQHVSAYESLLFLHLALILYCISYFCVSLFVEYTILWTEFLFPIIFCEEPYRKKFVECGFQLSSAIVIIPWVFRFNRMQHEFPLNSCHLLNSLDVIVFSILEIFFLLAVFCITEF